MMMVVRVCVCDAARLGAKGDTFRRPARASFAWRNFAFLNFTYEGPLGPAIGRTSEVVAGGARTFFERVSNGWGSCLLPAGWALRAQPVRERALPDPKEASSEVLVRYRHWPVRRCNEAG